MQTATRKQLNRPTPPVGAASGTEQQITLLDLVAAVVDASDSDEEVIATVQHLIDTGRVELVGQFCNVDLLVE